MTVCFDGVKSYKCWHARILLVVFKFDDKKSPVNFDTSGSKVPGPNRPKVPGRLNKKMFSMSCP